MFINRLLVIESIIERGCTAMIASRLRTQWPMIVIALAFMIAQMLPGAAMLHAQESFQATHYGLLTGAEEVPSVETDGVGVIIMRLDELAGTLEYRISVTGLSGPITAAHFHTGSYGETGPPVHSITFPPGKTTATGRWTGLTPDDISNINTGGIYVNVHTTQNPEGEIRSQIEAHINGFALLDAQSEVPAGTDTVARGTALLLIDPTTHTILYSVNWQGLSGPATNAHFHRGAPGVAGPVVQPITLQTGDSSTTGTWAGISNDDWNALMSGQIYINIHTAKHQSGEIRGQVLMSDLYTAAISATNEVPPATASTGEGTGYALFDFDPRTGVGVLNGGFVIGGTTGIASVAHLHRGAKGANGGVILPLNVAGDVGEAWIADYTLFGADTAASLRASGVYANFHTAQFPNGELRGQLIPGALNLAAQSASVPGVAISSGSNDLRATLDPVSGALTIRVDDPTLRTHARVALYSTLGELISTVPVDGNIVRFNGGDLPAGMYLVQLIVDNRMAASTRVVIAR
jgi:hypothetical protein